MNLSEAATKTFHQLEGISHQIRNLDCTRSANVLSGSTIGQHFRRTLEFFMCFRAGFQHCTRKVARYIKLNHDFGVAASTIRFNIVTTLSSNRYSFGSC
jgi:hypothetical protein